MFSAIHNFTLPNFHSTLHFPNSVKISTTPSRFNRKNFTATTNSRIRKLRDYGGGISYGLLHTVLRWTRGGEISVHQLHCERAGHALREATEVGPRSADVAEIQRLGSLPHAWTYDVGFSTVERRGLGSSFIHMPLMKRVLRLAVERDPWDQLEISVPYPTGFHPKSKSEMDQWLGFVRTRERTSLFTFVGGKRKVKGDFRTILLSHCYNESDTCRVVDCSGTRCYDGTSEILEAFLASDFCLQPRGDAFTRRSTFDCMLAGSIPVFFWKRSIYNQYHWFLGDEPEKFSVLIDRKDVRNGTSIRKVLEGFSRDEVRKMREKVISLVPKFVYSSMPSDEIESGKDAFDIAIDGVLRRFQEQKWKKNMVK
ncbi:hypothetical protein DH2020_040960 [Rehmannia glutinosa]|uniref:Exostosin GT47 domain-containing protein n=1 Tax=Rehmannia glutinosa TaxID=99300 RepID=A0ABR0USR7_REHGL